MTTISPLELQPDLVQRAYDAVLDAICDGRLSPGERITQEALAAELGVSRQPVLQAFARLRREGFLTDVGRKGVQVTPLDMARLEQVYQVRAELDGLAAALAAGQPEAQRLQAVAEARTWLAESDAADAATRSHANASNADLARLIAADMAFHRWLYRASGNPLIEPTLAMHWQHLRRYMGMVLSHFPARESIRREHESIVLAVEAGHVSQARDQAKSHAIEASRSLRERLLATQAQDLPPEPHDNRRPACN